MRKVVMVVAECVVREREERRTRRKSKLVVILELKEEGEGLAREIQ